VQYHQKYLEKGGRFNSPQSAAKNCNDPIRSVSARTERGESLPLHTNRAFAYAYVCALLQDIALCVSLLLISSYCAGGLHDVLVTGATARASYVEIRNHAAAAQPHRALSRSQAHTSEKNSYIHSLGMHLGHVIT
jgi:hypothetical protein